MENECKNIEVLIQIIEQLFQNNYLGCYMPRRHALKMVEVIEAPFPRAFPTPSKQKTAARVWTNEKDTSGKKQSITPANGYLSSIINTGH